jgi:hypothetical protein
MRRVYGVRDSDWRDTHECMRRDGRSGDMINAYEGIVRYEPVPLPDAQLQGFDRVRGLSATRTERD